MTDFFADPTVRAVIAILVLCILIAIAFKFMASFRDYTAQDQENAEDVLANLREMHLKGDISDEEFRTIQATTHSHLQGAMNPDDSPAPGESPPTD